jgi:HEAT repeat protein
VHGLPKIRSLLQRGDRRTVGDVAEAVEQALQHPDLLPVLVECLFDDDAAVRMRAADALEKFSQLRCRELQRYTAVLLSLFEETEQQELRWHLAVILPRLRLSSAECLRASEALQACMEARSSIVRTFALQGLFDLTVQQPSLRPLVLDLLRSAERSGTPAMKARSRRLLATWEKQAQ